MRENRTYGSEGGEAKAFPTPIVAPPQPRVEGFAAAPDVVILQGSDLPNRVDGRDEPGHDG